MAMKKGFCLSTVCNKREEVRRIFDVNSETQFCYCPYCGKKYRPKVAIFNYEKRITRYDKKAKFFLKNVGQPLYAYNLFAYVLELEPTVNVLEFGALYTPSSAKVDVDPFISALKQACLNTNKVEIIEHCKVNEVLISNYCVTGIKTEAQDIYSAPIVLATVGVWTNDLGAPLTQYT